MFAVKVDKKSLRTLINRQIRKKEQGTSVLELAGLCSCHFKLCKGYFLDIVMPDREITGYIYGAKLPISKKYL